MATVRKRKLPSGLIRWQASYVDGAGKRRAKRLDGTPICCSGSGIIGEIVNKGGMNHTIRCSRSAAQAVKIIERTAQHLRTSSGN